MTIMVTHDRDEAYQLCDNLLLMDRGCVLAAGRTRDIFQNPVTCRAARLTGCKNISRIERLGERRIRAVDWDGLELATDRPVGDAITGVGIRAHDFEPLSESSARAYMEREDANLIKYALHVFPKCRLSGILLYRTVCGGRRRRISTPTIRRSGSPVAQGRALRPFAPDR